MNAPVVIIGLGADGPCGLRRELLDQINAADFLAGGSRHLDLFPNARAERLPITNNLTQLADELGRRGGQRRVVLASGDPLFFGIGKYLTEHLGPQAVRVEPAVSSMQMAFARAGLSWQDAALASVHGRDLRATLLPLLGRPCIGLFTDEGNNPAAVARFILEGGPGDYEAFVGENLGTAAERLSGWVSPAAVANGTFAALSYLVLRRRRQPAAVAELERLRGLVPGVPDEEFDRPTDGPEVMTRQEVRSVILGRMAGTLAPGDTAWDIGTGLGTVAVELAVLRPHVEVVAVERDGARAAFARRNRERFGAYNVRVVEGEAPAALHGESERPRAVFLGGSGTCLGDILDLVVSRLRDGGAFLAAFVTLEHLAMALQRLQQRRWPVDVTHVQVARADVLGKLTGLKPLRGVFLLGTRKAVS
jgi:precorrin-6Y C5,15-methyltransferase (decarboxylating)